MDHLTALKVFRQVVERGGFAAASRRMGLSPAAVSKNIAELEAHLAARLLNRTTRRMSLTEAGARYYEQVARILDDLNEAEQSLGPLQQAPSGTLRVSAPMSLSLVRLSAAMPRFLARYPQVSLDLNLEDRRIDIVKEGYDLAIRGTDRLEDSSLVARKLMTLDHVLCGAPAYFERHGAPASPLALRGMECVQFTLSGHAAEWTFKRGEQTERVPVRGRYKVSSSLAVRDALRAGFGVSLVPRVYVQQDLDSGALQAVLEDWTPDETFIYAVYPSRRHMVAKVRAFVDFLLEELDAPRE
ncbi:LysR family transcriptional regulator [Achromobacter anxifer]|jgi:DNA-binding transcriptional LysR family regulator|uniref:HTH-type transcriptional regulator DmlR n=1 Tax=Achromobacter anxifer TaxID=1287737 RepID=A0A6S7EQ67_9BURK|nr:LysR family transcriptional regulator [Achromobacter anxifer]MDF8359781.1 LysR family transcriptional regulator [Achromobacter anxifer]CAB3918103.1 HTH-type transcriptional regulator DmlR [Achromobacter anxifer]CAB5511391.1 HTH-type transcriptional regulator DmlR [Achromobacter anxifer]